MKPPIPNDALPAGFSGDPAWEPQVPVEKLRRWGIGLFIASLASLFAATLLAYVIIRYTGQGVPVPGSLHTPPSMAWSTGALLICGGVMAWAQRLAARGRVLRVAGPLVLGWSLSIAFLILQSPGMVQLIESHRANTSQNIRGADGLLFTLIALHALHVLGGLLPLTRLALLALRGNITPAHRPSVRSCATYWHFLEIVWLAMFGTFLMVK